MRLKSITGLFSLVAFAWVSQTAVAGLLPPSSAPWRTLTCTGDKSTLQLDHWAGTVTLESTAGEIKTVLSGLYCQNSQEADPRILSCWLDSDMDAGAVFSSKLGAAFLDGSAYFEIEIRSPAIAKLAAAHQLESWGLFRLPGRTNDVANRIYSPNVCSLK